MTTSISNKHPLPITIVCGRVLGSIVPALYIMQCHSLAIFGHRQLTQIQ